MYKLLTRQKDNRRHRRNTLIDIWAHLELEIPDKPTHRSNEATQYLPVMFNKIWHAKLRFLSRPDPNSAEAGPICAVFLDSGTQNTT